MQLDRTKNFPRWTVQGWSRMPRGDFQSPSLEGRSNPGLISLLTLLWAGAWTRDLLSSPATWVRLWYSGSVILLFHNFSLVMAVHFWLIAPHFGHRLCTFINFYACGRRKRSHQQKGVEHLVISCHKGKIFITVRKFQ